MVRESFSYCLIRVADNSAQATSDRALGSLMLFVAGFVFVYYSAWALLQVSNLPKALCTNADRP